MRDIDLLVEKLLKDNGFKFKGTTWYRATGEVLQIINFQHSSWSHKYWMNIAMDLCTKNLRDFGRIWPKEYEIPIRIRSEMVKQTADYIPSLDYDVSMSDIKRTQAVNTLTLFWIHFLDSVKTRETLLKAIEEQRIIKAEEIYFFFWENNDLLDFRKKLKKQIE